MGPKPGRTLSPDFVARNLMKAAPEVFRADPRVRSLGVGQHDGYGFIAIRNTKVPLPQNMEIRPIEALGKIPVSYVDTTSDPENLAKMIQVGATTEDEIPEQHKHRPLVCGLEIQNFDDDLRSGLTAKRQIRVGTIGCMVRLRDGNLGFISNNHVVAGQNHGLRARDRIMQAGRDTISDGEEAGILSDFVRLRSCSGSANVVLKTTRLNIVDAGCVQIAPPNEGRQHYLPLRNVPAPSGTAKARIGDKVFKVGRTTGLKRGVVTQSPVVAGPISYEFGPCWFGRALIIESTDKEPFSDSGDSGSAIVREDDGKVIGLLFAGNGTQTWACPIEEVTRALKCELL